MPFLQTERLTLVPLSREIAMSAMRDRARLAALLAAHVPDDWPEPDFAGFLPVLRRALRKDPACGEWFGIIIHTADRTVVGDMGFHGPPDEEGMVEIGYSILPAFRRRGYAFEMARALIGWALARPEITRITATGVAAGNRGSIRVLEKVGMQCTRRDGDLLSWELRRP